MIMCVLLCYPVSIRIYYQQGGLFLVSVEITIFITFLISHHFVALSDGILVIDVPKMGIIFNKSL